MGSAIGSIVGIGASVAKAVSAGKQKRNAQRAINNYQRQDLGNAYNDMQVSTLGADLQQEESARYTSSMVDALRQSGQRGIIGGLGRVAQQSNLLNNQIGASLDEQQRQIQLMRAQDEQQIRNIKELRDRENLQGLGAQLNQGNQQMWSGIDQVPGQLANFNNDVKSAMGSLMGGMGGGGGMGSAVGGG